MSDKPALHPNAAVGKALVGAAHAVLAEARAAIDESRKSDAQAVHDFRKAMKRWRALLRLLEPQLGGEARRLRNAARNLARKLSGARDMQSAIEALEELGETRGALPAALRKSMLARLQHLRTAAEATTLTPDMRLHLRAAVSAAEDAVGRWRLDGLGFADVAVGLAQTYRRARRSVPKDWDKARPKALHELRQRVVDHRYQMELIEPLWPRLGRVWTAEAQRLRDRLGSHQDLVLLAGFAAPRRPLAGWRTRLAPVIEQHQRDLTKSAARIAGRLFAESPKAFHRRLVGLWQARAGSGA
jgi:CHAD domain-containing protein